MNEKTKYRLKIILVVSYMVFIYLFSEYKFPTPPSSGDDPVVDLLFPILHMGEFALLSMLLMFAFYDKINTGIILSISILYGISDEIHQYFVPYRWFGYEDILYDVIGSILGIIGYFVLILSYFFVFSKIRWNNIDNLTKYELINKKRCSKCKKKMVLPFNIEFYYFFGLIKRIYCLNCYNKLKHKSGTLELKKVEITHHPD